MTTRDRRNLRKALQSKRSNSLAAPWSQVMQSPSPEQVHAVRERAGWTKEKAADTVLVPLRSWQA